MSFSEPADVGVFAPYGRCEETDFALAIIAELSGLGCSTQYYAGSSATTGLHCWWDANVDRRAWAKDNLPVCETRLWLQPRPMTPVSRSRDVRLLAQPDEFTFSDALNDYHLVGCDTKATKRAVVKQRPFLKRLSDIIPWCGLPIDGFVPPRKLHKSLLCIANNGMLKHDGFRLLAALRHLLIEVPDASVVLVAMTSSIVSCVEDRLWRYATELDGRLRAVLRPSSADRQKLYGECDVAWLALRPPFSDLLPQEALEHCRPAILLAKDYSGTLVKHKRRGWLLSEEWSEDLANLFAGRDWEHTVVDDEAIRLVADRRKRFTTGVARLLE